MNDQLENQEEKGLTAGEILKQTRESKSLSLDVIHEETKIPIDALRAIEDGYTIRTLSSFYRKSFRKKYAQYLNIDISEIVEEKIEEPKKEPLIRKPLRPPVEQKYAKERFMDFDLKDWLAKILTPERKKIIVMVLGACIVLFLLFKFFAFIANRKPKEKVKISTVRQEFPKEEEKVIPPQVIAPVRTPVVAVERTVKPSPQESVSIKENVSVAIVVNKQVSLTVRANEKSWLRVKSDGIVVFQTSLIAGAVETWEADSQIEISGRNLNKLEFELNGKLIGKLGRDDRKAKKVVVTKDGLSVVK